MEEDITTIKISIEEALSIFLEQLDENGVDTDYINIRLQYDDGLNSLELR